MVGGTLRAGSQLLLLLLLLLLKYINDLNIKVILIPFLDRNYVFAPFLYYIVSKILF